MACLHDLQIFLRMIGRYKRVLSTVSACVMGGQEGMLVVVAVSGETEYDLCFKNIAFAVEHFWRSVKILFVEV